jgi:hypothetical protein
VICQFFINFNFVFLCLLLYVSLCFWLDIKFLFEVVVLIQIEIAIPDKKLSGTISRMW